MAAPNTWTPSSWKSKPAAQGVAYPDEEHLSKVLTKISTLPPLVTPSEIERLRYQLGQVERGDAFLLHAGDCAESFDACTSENIANKIGMYFVFTSTFTYLVTAYRPIAASAMAANSALRSMFAAAFPLFAGAMYRRLGTVGATALLAGLTAVMAPLPQVSFFSACRL
ncbi:hypothetical protein FIBSPDRAFT_1045579 [Athelia psychrophila]|uniref:Phospho-2-dehydro-3-deoxyheptonate aldolase n=1 Tax=Athelia psychrophila TaxID=1759441 RepID=A0A166HZA7_9AGAM|nr:hypothetical protein FIBSPDRAFT_1045579 [Fibularhizoctonia sp. CBS 109695]